MHKDFLGRPLAIDDAVAVVDGPENLRFMYVHSFTPKKVRLRYDGGSVPIRVRFPSQIAKLEAL